MYDLDSKINFSVFPGLQVGAAAHYSILEPTYGVRRLQTDGSTTACKQRLSWFQVGRPVPGTEACRRLCILCIWQESKVEPEGLRHRLRLVVDLLGPVISCPAAAAACIVMVHHNKLSARLLPQGGPHNHTISGLACALKQATTPEFKQYQEQVCSGLGGFEINMFPLCNELTAMLIPSDTAQTLLPQAFCSLRVGFPAAILSRPCYTQRACVASVAAST